MPITRTFVDWSQPILEAAADYLAERFTQGNECDLSNALVVLPGRRAGRLLLEKLVELAERRNLILVPPILETTGDLPEQLYTSQRQPAVPTVQRLAWVKALREIGRQRISRLVAQLPPDDDLPRWLELAELFRRQHRELAADGLNFQDVADSGTKSSFHEGRRWLLLRELQLKYFEILRQLDLWDRQTARLLAVQNNECRTDKQIILVATADVNRTLKSMLPQVADHVTALVHAPEDFLDHFDAFGCLDPQPWQSTPIPLRTEQVRIVSDPPAQARAVAEALAEFDGAYPADKITIGVPDTNLQPHIQQQLSQLGIPTRTAVEKTLPETAPYRLLKSIADWVESRNLADLAVLLRHADVGDWLLRTGMRGDWLTELDEYRNEHLQIRLTEWLGPEHHRAIITRVTERLDTMVEPLREKVRPLPEWPDEIVTILTSFYEGVELNREDAADHETLSACEEIQKVLDQHRAVPSLVAPQLSGVDAIRMALDEAATTELPSLPDEHAVELLGWLELPTDPAPALIVTSLNEGIIPTSLNSDLFLPNRLRGRLKITDNARRYARDAYALNVLLASRERLTLIVQRRNGDGDPQIPSRLLFAADPLTIARRAEVFFDPNVTAETEEAWIAGGPAQRADSDLPIPRPVPQPEPLQSLSVTAFRAYLACPYRFYLRYVLRLNPIDDAAEEMDAAVFGSLLHQVLEDFGRSDIRDSTHAGEIEDYLRRVLKRNAREQLGRHWRPAVGIQVQRAGARLSAFAKWQAEWSDAGWRIRQSEATTKPYEISIGDGRSLKVTGRIDRIDQNERSGEWMVFDYKTGNSATSPKAAHFKRGEWIDLQLPLYRHLAALPDSDSNVGLGYIVLPKDTDQVGPMFAEWNEQELAVADAVSVDVARRVLDQAFWPPKEPAPRMYPEFAAICQDGVFRSSTAAEDEAPVE